MQEMTGVNFHCKSKIKGELKRGFCLGKEKPFRINNEFIIIIF